MATQRLFREAVVGQLARVYGQRLQKNQQVIRPTAVRCPTPGKSAPDQALPGTPPSREHFEVRRSPSGPDRRASS
jgi:hypothetical protein